MNLKTEITQKMKDAMRRKDNIALSTYRSIINAITNNEKNKKPVSDIDLLTSLAKQRNQSIEQYEKANNSNAVMQEKEELDIIQEFLPKQMSNDDILNAVNDILNTFETKPTIKQMGQVIGMFKSKYKGQDMSNVSKIIKSKLS